MWWFILLLNPYLTDCIHCKTGVFVDAIVDGAAYKTATQSGFTNADGEYNYKEGENVKFSLGGYSLVSMHSDFNRSVISRTKAKEHLNETLNRVNQGAANTSAVGNNSFNTYDLSTLTSSICNLVSLVVPSGISASVGGRSNATYADPLDLTTALSSSSPLQAGETLWIKELS